MSSIPAKTKFSVAIGIAVLAIVGLLVFNGGASSPKQASLDRLAKIERAITSFVETNNEAPATLSELGFAEEELKDHTGEPFKYIVSEDSITVLSYGSDKEPGGSFFKRDFSVTIDLPR